MRRDTLSRADQRSSRPCDRAFRELCPALGEQPRSRQQRLRGWLKMRFAAWRVTIRQTGMSGCVLTGVFDHATDSHECFKRIAATKRPGDGISQLRPPRESLGPGGSGSDQSQNRREPHLRRLTCDAAPLLEIVSQADGFHIGLADQPEFRFNAGAPKKAL